MSLDSLFAVNLSQQFLKSILATGTQWVIVLLLLCSVLSLGIILERWRYFARYRGHFPSFLEELAQRLQSQEPRSHIAAWCSGQPTLEARVAAAGLQHTSGQEALAENAMIAVLLASRTHFEKGLIILGTLANNTPFIGLLGTIIGIIQAFQALSAAAQNGPPIMALLAEALVATALGIFVAIPAVIFYNVFQRLIKTKTTQAQATARLVLSHLAVPPPPSFSQPSTGKAS